MKFFPSIEDNTEEREKARAKCNASVIHQADKLLRKTVSNKIKQCKEFKKSKEEVKEKASELNAIKCELLEDLKTGFTTLPEDVVVSVTNGKKEGIEKLDTFVKQLFEMKIK